MVNISEVSGLDYMKTAKTPFVTTIKHIPKNSHKLFKIEQSAVILCNDLEDMQEFNDKVFLSNRYPKKLKFLVVCEKSMTGNFTKPRQLNFADGKMLDFQFFLTNKAGSIDLETYEWFLEGTCNQPQLTQVNSFTKTTLKWETQLVVKNKFSNFNNCTITYQFRFNNEDSCISEHEIHSFLLDILKAVSSKGNFQIKLVYREQPRDSFNVEIHEDAQIFLLESVYGFATLKDFHITTAYTEHVLGFVVPPGELYTIYEKLYLPFDDLTWIFLIITFGFAFGFILSLRFAPPRIRDLIYGEGVRMPAFNVIGIFFGMGQVRLPETNFPRIILMTFILFCLIIRTAYQGVFFEMMTHNLEKPTPNTFDDLYEQNFTLLLPEYFIPYVNTIPESRRPHVNTSLLNDYYFKHPHVSSKIALITFLNNKLSVDEFFMIGFRHILEERLVTFPVGLRFPKNHFLLLITDEVVQNLQSVGIIDHLRSYRRSVCYKNAAYEEDEWEAYIFALDDLLFGFYIWLVAIGFCLLVIALELTWFYGKRAAIRISKTTIGLYIILVRLQRGFGL